KKQEVVPLSMVQVALHVELGAVRQAPRPSAEHVRAGYLDAAEVNARHCSAILRAPAVAVGQERHRVACAEPIRAEARLIPAPLVERRLAARPQSVIEIRRLGVHSIMPERAYSTAIAHGGAILEVAACHGDKPASSLVGRPCDYVDDAVDG